MPPKKNPASGSPNYLLKITLCKTISPTVTRLISVPAELSFKELHFAIVAAFGWDLTSDPCNIWHFRQWNDDSVKYCDNLKYKGALAIYSTIANSGFDLHPSQHKSTAKVSQYFEKLGPGKFWTYDYDLARFHHAIEVVDMDDDHKGKVECFGGQGQVGRRAWQFADFAGVEGVKVGAKSAWDLDMRAVNLRLGVVKEGFEKRMMEERGKLRGKEATKKATATAKTPAGKAKGQSSTSSETAAAQLGSILCRATAAGSAAPTIASRKPSPSNNAFIKLIHSKTSASKKRGIANKSETEQAGKKVKISCVEGDEDELVAFKVEGK